MASSVAVNRGSAGPARTFRVEGSNSMSPTTSFGGCNVGGRRWRAAGGPGAPRNRTASPSSRQRLLQPHDPSETVSRAVSIKIGSAERLALNARTTSSPRDLRHPPIDDGHLVLVGAQEPERLFTVCDGVDYIPVFAEAALEDGPEAPRRPPRPGSA